MRKVKTAQLDGIQLEWALSQAQGESLVVHEYEDYLYLVPWDESRKTPVQKFEASLSDSIAFISISTKRLTVTPPSDVSNGWVVEGYADPRPYGSEPRAIIGTGESLMLAVFRAICSYVGDEFSIPDDVAALHDRRLKHEAVEDAEMMADDDPTYSELVAMGAFDGHEFT